MSTGKIEELVSTRGLEQVEELHSKLGILKDDLANLTGEAIKFNNAIGNSKTMQEYAQNTAEAAQAIDNVGKSVEKTRLAEINLQKAREKAFDDYEKKLAKQQAAQEKAEAQNLARIQKLQAAQEKADAKIIADSQKKQSQVDKESRAFAEAEERKNIALAKSNRAFNLLNQRYQDAIKNAKDIGAAQGATSQAFIDATEHANKLGKQIDGINTPLGDFKNKVGGYTEGIANYFGKAFGFLRQAAYILPGIGIAGIFNLAGEAIVSLAQKLDLFSGRVTQASRDQSALNDIYKESDKSAGEQITRLQYLYKAATDVNNSTKDRKLAVNELQKEFPNYFKNISDETILNGGAKKSYDELNISIVENARALSAANKIAELRGRLLDTDIQKAKVRAAEGNELIKLTQDIKAGKFDQTGTGEGGGGILEDNQAKRIHDNAVKAIKDQDDLANGYKATIKVVEQVVGGPTKIGNALAGSNDNTDKTPKGKTQTGSSLLSEQLKAMKLLEDIVLNSDKSTYAERLQAIYQFEQSSEDLILKAEKNKVITQLEASNMAGDIEKTGAAQRLKIEQDVQKELASLFKQGAVSLEGSLQQEIIDLKDNQDSKLLAIDQFKSEALKGIADQYRDGKISAAQYNQQVYDIDAQAAKDRVDLQIDTIQKIIDARKEDLFFGIGSAKELQKVQDDLTKLQIQSSDLATKIEIDNVLKLQQAKKELAQLEKELIVQSIDLIKTLVDTGYQNQISALQAQSQQVQDNGDLEKRQINNSIKSTKEKARETSIVDAQTASNQKNLANQEAKIKREQAKFDKIASIAKIIYATGVAEVQALSYLSNPFTAPLYPVIAGLIAGIGAVQLATVAAAPLPQFEKGGTVKKDGNIITGEAGTELRIDPSGRTSFTADHANVTYAKAGTKIINNKDLVKMLGKPEQVQYIVNATNDNKKVEKLLEQNNELQRRSKRPVVNVFNDRFGSTYAKRNY